MAPSGYIQSRQQATQQTNFFATLVDNRPYLPNLSVDISNEASLRLVAIAVLLLNVAQDMNYDGASNGTLYRLVTTDLEKENEIQRFERVHW